MTNNRLIPDQFKKQFKKLKSATSLPFFDLEKAYTALRGNHNVLEIALLNSFISEKQVESGFAFATHSYSSISNLEIEYFMKPVLLKDADQMSMRNSIELRVPFLDHRLVEQEMLLDDSYKRGASISKERLILLSDLDLNYDFFKVKKQGFSLPFDNWIQNDLKSYVENALNRLSKHDLFQRDLTRNVIEAHNKKIITSSAVMSLVSLDAWIEKNGVIC